MVSDKTYIRTRYGGILFGFILGAFGFMFRDWYKKRQRKKELNKRSEAEIKGII